MNFHFHHHVIVILAICQQQSTMMNRARTSQSKTTYQLNQMYLVATVRVHYLLNIRIELTVNLNIFWKMRKFLKTYTTSSVIYTDFTEDPTPFLTVGGGKALPCYSGKKNEDINAFFFKLCIFLSHPSISNCHTQKHTTCSNYVESKNLSTPLGLCISGEALHPFLVNSRFDNKGIELYRHLKQMQNSIQHVSASTLSQSMFHTKIKGDESFDSFRTRLRTIYRSCIKAGFPEDEAYLIRYYIRRLDSNYDNVRDLLDTNALDWSSKTLDEVIQITTVIKFKKVPLESSGPQSTLLTMQWVNKAQPDPAAPYLLILQPHCRKQIQKTFLKRQPILRDPK